MPPTRSNGGTTKKGVKGNTKTNKKAMKSDPDHSYNSSSRSPSDDSASHDSSDKENLSVTAKNRPPVRQAPRAPNRSWKSLPYPKGSFVLRLSDVIDDNEFHCIWKVDNYQLIRKYLKEEGANDWFVASNRYAGWLTNEVWRFLPVEVDEQSKSDTEEKVRILWPSKEKVGQAMARIEVEEATLKEESEENAVPQATVSPASAKSAIAVSKSTSTRRKPKAKKPRMKKRKMKEESEEEESEEDGASDEGEDDGPAPIPPRKRGSRTVNSAASKKSSGNEDVETIDDDD